MSQKRIASVVLVLTAAAAVSSQSSAQPTSAPKLPVEATLVKPLGFRTAPGLGDGFVIPNRNYLQPPTRIKLVSANGPMWAPNTYCQAEFEGKKGWVRCDDASAMSVAAQAPTTVSQPPSTTPGPARGEIAYKGRYGYGVTCFTKYATALSECLDYCKQACDPLPANPTAEGAWKGWDCRKLQSSADGILPSSSPNLKNVRRELSDVKDLQIEVGASVRATADVVAGLRRLDAWVKASASADERAKYRVRVNNCWRDNADDSSKECGFVLRSIDPQTKGLAWPGANPHSAGNACDIVVENVRTGNAMFGFKVTPEQATPEVRAASRYLDKAVTAAGGRRLGYETWHYEWGGPAGNGRCTFPDCDSYWPPKGTSK